MEGVRMLPLLTNQSDPNPSPWAGTIAGLIAVTSVASTLLVLFTV
jgi:hypothetical protein